MSTRSMTATGLLLGARVPRHRRDDRDGDRCSRAARTHRHNLSIVRFTHEAQGGQARLETAFTWRTPHAVLMDELQRSLERYDVLDRIAVGGMAEVFLAKAYGAHGFEKTLAIKRILPELARDPEFEARFIAEAKVAVRLSHANVVQVFDFGRIAESLFIAMEYVDGLDLAALLRKHKDEGKLVPLPAAFHIAIEIVRGLDFAHQHNVVHRDVSPSNTLLSRAGEVKIADFGIAIAASPHRGGGTGTGPRKVMGKWRYMSPEQARGDTLDTRSGDLTVGGDRDLRAVHGAEAVPGRRGRGHHRQHREDGVAEAELDPAGAAVATRRDSRQRAGAATERSADAPGRDPAAADRAVVRIEHRRDRARRRRGRQHGAAAAAAVDERRARRRDPQAARRRRRAVGPRARPRSPTASRRAPRRSSATKSRRGCSARSAATGCRISSSTTRSCRRRARSATR